MPLDPDAAALLSMMAEAGMPPMETMEPQEVRAGAAAAAALAPEPDVRVASVLERTLGGVPSLVVTPEGAGPFHVLIWFHGGGWVIGSAAEWLPTAKELAAGAGTVVVVPDYRLAPEHPFPAAFDDALEVTRAVLEHATELGGPGAKVAVGGDSAGGNLAALAALHIEGLAHQILAYPVTDATMAQPSYATMASDYLLTASMMEWFINLYAGDHDPADPRISPLHAPEEAFRRACPAHVVLAAYDPLHDEGEAYARRLRDAGVAVTTSRYDGQMHGFFTMGAVVPTGMAALHEAIGHLRHALGSPPAAGPAHAMGGDAEPGDA